MFGTRAIVKTAVVGFLVLLPTLVFVVIVGWILGLFGSLLHAPANFLAQHFHFPLLLAYASAFALFGVMCFGIGVFMKASYGRRCIRYFENLLGRIPGYELVHTLVGQMTQNPGESTGAMAFKVVRLPLSCERKIGLITSEWGGWCMVWVPSAPAPTNGMVSLWRREELEVMSGISAAEAMQCIFANGVGFAEWFGRAIEAAQAKAGSFEAASP